MPCVRRKVEKAIHGRELKEIQKQNDDMVVINTLLM
jgi:hypothetical protein